jgi:DNA-binding response OmpR family regulator
MTKITVIEDDEAMRDVLIEVLEREGFEVNVANNGDEGLKLLRESSADLVITDVIMPHKNGIDTVREIRAEFPDTRIIVISGGGNITPMEYEPSAITTTAYLALASVTGADVTLTKPFARQELLDAVRELVQA